MEFLKNLRYLDFAFSGGQNYCLLYTPFYPLDHGIVSPLSFIPPFGGYQYKIFLSQGYGVEIAKQHATLKALEENPDNSHAAITKRKKDKVKIQEVLDRLSSEVEQQEQNAKAVHHRLIHEKDSWLTSCPDLIKVNIEFLQRCIFPRCVVSMMDAIYCARHHRVPTTVYISTLCS